MTAPATKPASDAGVDVYLALGSNMGDRYQNILKALSCLRVALLDETCPTPLPANGWTAQAPQAGIEQHHKWASLLASASMPSSPGAHQHKDGLETSFLYETAPKYVTDQPRFLNAVCRIKTRLPPDTLLDRVKGIETFLGRVPTVRNGPRAIDIDILFYGSRVWSDGERLQIPHPRIHEREFVLRPLCDLDPSFVHPTLHRPLGALLHALPAGGDYCSEDLQRVLPVGKRLLPVRDSCRKTYVMGVVNVTPDSFSDGGAFFSTDRAVSHSIELFQHGADVVDIGGQSTRPNAVYVPASDEMARVLPVIGKLASIRGGKSPLPSTPATIFGSGLPQPSSASGAARGIDPLPSVQDLLVSIDTFRASVARAAVDAGADLINDVSAGTLDDDMLPAAAQLCVPIVLMHMRGDSQSMAGLASYTKGRVVEEVAAELNGRVSQAIKMGVYRWNIVIDPGIGFAKAAEHNYELLRNLGKLTALVRGFPVLSGPSRKRFIAHALPRDSTVSRVWGTAAAVSASIQQGADIVRVHDVKEMVAVASVSDALWRRGE